MMTPSSSESPLELVLVTGDRQRRFALPERVIFGRGEDADIRLQDPRLSRLHCRFQRDGQGVKVTDLGSANGTRVDGQEVSQVRVGPGSCVALSSETSIWVLRKGQAVPAGKGSRPAAQPPAPAPSGAKAPPRSKAPLPVAATAPAMASAAAAAPAGVAERPAERIAPRPERKWTGLVIAGVVGVAIVVLVVIGMQPDPEALAIDGRKEIDGLIEKREFGMALQRTEAFLSEHAGTQAAREVRAALESWREGEARRGRGRKELSQIIADQAREPLPRTLERFEAFCANFPDSFTAEELREQEDRLVKVAEQRSDREIGALEPTIRSALSQGDFGRADRLIATGEESPLLTESARSRLSVHRRRLERAARSNLTRVLKEIDGRSASESVKLLRKESPRFRGLSIHGLLRARIDLLEANIAQHERDAAERATAAGQPRPTRIEEPKIAPAADLVKALGEAESLASERRYREAAAAFLAAAEEAQGEQRARLERRAARMGRVHAVLGAVIERIQSDKRAFRDVDLGNGMTGNVRSADFESVEVSIGAGARVRWFWKRISAQRVERLMKRALMRGALAVDQALVLLEWEAPEQALRVLAEVYERSPDARQRAHEIAAEARGMSAVPEDGFFVFDDQMLTRSEYDVAVRAAAVARLRLQVVRAEDGAWSQAAAELQAKGDDGQAALRAALTERLQVNLTRVREAPELSPKRMRALSAALFAELNQRREAALKLIFDEGRYPYPYGPDQKKVQAEVDGLVDKVRVLWESPSRELIARFAELKPVIEDSKAVEAALSGFNAGEEGEQGEKVQGVAAIFAAIDERIALKNFRADPAASKLLDHFEKVKAYNDSLGEDVISSFERDCHATTNRYRVMLGRRAVMIAPTLVVAARGHSQEMLDMGYFAHESPVPGRKSPSDRARIAGWGGGVSENIAFGRETGAGAVAGWIGSSGHHRNLLGTRWTHLGCGKSKNGTYWTQNFGKGSANPPSPKPRRKEDDGKGRGR